MPEAEPARLAVKCVFVGMHATALRVCLIYHKSRMCMNCVMYAGCMSATEPALLTFRCVCVAVWVHAAAVGVQCESYVFTRCGWSHAPTFGCVCVGACHSCGCLLGTVRVRGVRSLGMCEGGSR
jgi:hypothetical protein